MRAAPASASQCTGEPPSPARSRRYKPPRSSPGSVDVPTVCLFVPGNGPFVPLDKAWPEIEDADVTPDRRAIVCCGGETFAVVDLFLLPPLGYPDLAPYDGMPRPSSIPCPQAVQSIFIGTA